MVRMPFEILSQDVDGKCCVLRDQLNHSLSAYGLLGELAQQQENASKLNEAQEVLGLHFVSGSDPSETLEPSDRPFYLPPTTIATQRTPILGLLSVLAIGGDHLNAQHLELSVEPIAVIGLIPDQPLSAPDTSPKIAS